MTETEGATMADGAISIRLMKAGDLEAVVGIDEKVLKTARPEYYAWKFEKLFEYKDALATSLVAEDEDRTVVGFVIGELYIGEYGILHDVATLDTIGVDPQHQHRGIGQLLISEYVDHLRTLGVQRVRTLVGWNDPTLVRFFSENRFTPSPTIHLERAL
jgi:predicted N-acetyltransferase YhbS